jgi:hypothetical protein
LHSGNKTLRFKVKNLLINAFVKCQAHTPHKKRFKINGKAFAVQGVGLKGEVQKVYRNLPAALENYPEEVWLGDKKFYRHAASKCKN